MATPPRKIEVPLVTQVERVWKAIHEMYLKSDHDGQVLIMDALTNVKANSNYDGLWNTIVEELNFQMGEKNKNFKNFIEKHKDVFSDILDPNISVKINDALRQTLLTKEGLNKVEEFLKEPIQKTAAKSVRLNEILVAGGLNPPKIETTPGFGAKLKKKLFGGPNEPPPLPPITPDQKKRLRDL